MRKWLAGSLIRLAHLIYPPKVTEVSWSPAMTVSMAEPAKAAALLRQYAEHRGSRGWN